MGAVKRKRGFLLPPPPPLFIFLIIVVFSERSSLVVSAVNYTRYRPVGSLRLARIQRHLDKLNKPAALTIESPDGDIIDCVQKRKQPALDHPLLKNHKIQKAPPEMPKKRKMKDQEDGLGESNYERSSSNNSIERGGGAWQIWHQNGRRCPKGTVPIRRSTVHDVLRAKSLFDFGKKQRSSLPVSRRVDAPDVALFESKQRDQNSDSQKRRSTLDALTGPNKSVLRRWSAGTGGSSTKSETVSENFVTMTSDNLEGVDISRSSREEKPEPELISGDNNPVEAAKVETTLDTSEERTSDPIGDPAETIVTQQEENNEKLLASAEWTRQKEMELNQMLKKMMENKPVKYRTTAPNSKKKQDVLSQDVSQEQRGGFYDHYKGKRDAKLRRETAEKRAEREAQFKAMQQILDARKAEMASSNVKDFGRKSSPAKPQKLQKSLPQSANPKKESSKPAIAKKTLSKAPPAPAVRKSWPSAPSPRATTGISPARTPCGTSSAGITPTRRKPQTAPSAPRSSPKTERSLHELKNVKASQNDNRKGLKSVTEKTEKQQKPLTKNGKTAKPKVKTSPNEGSTVSPKPSFYSKVTKKSSVVPVESKPFLRKGSGAGPGIVKTKPSQPDETLRNSANSVQAQEDEMIADTSSPIPQQEADLEPIKTPILESVTQVNSPQKCDDTVSSEQVVVNGDDNLMTTIESSLQTETEEESVISPTAWVEIEEHHDLPIPQDDSASQIASTANDAAVPVSSPRVRHSLSQMLLEESAEPDIIEWGNAENPPGMVYQKDAPRGLKRLLKFARKSRADPNLTGWSSPSVFSEGEDEFDESKAASKKNADNLLRKAGLHPKNYMQQQKMSLGESFEKKSPGAEMISAQSATSKFSSQSSSSYKLQDHFTGAATATKATRSFFSLSAFRGSKPNETKLR